jgi:sugar phosphate isomerase/epimerase
MSLATFTLSAFGDEIDPDLQQQLRVLRDLKISYLELRGAWGKNVLQMDDTEVDRVCLLCKEMGVTVSCIGSPVGKSPISAPIEKEVSNLSRMFHIASKVGTRLIRVFSFYPPDTSSNARYDEYVTEAAERLARLTGMAEREGFLLLLENEKEIVGDVPERCHAIVSSIESPHLRFLWDPANFVQVGVAGTTEQGWPLLGQYVHYVHVKDALLADGSVMPAGEGDGQVRELLSRLRECEYRGFLSVEPHLEGGPDSMGRAVTSIRRLLVEGGCTEADVPGADS